jgi:hypothetical protein
MGPRPETSFAKLKSLPKLMLGTRNCRDSIEPVWLLTSSSALIADTASETSDSDCARFSAVTMISSISTDSVGSCPCATFCPPRSTATPPNRQVLLPLPVFCA